MYAIRSYYGYTYNKAIYIDPIDGTTNFVHGIPHLAISIGMWENGEPTHAVVYNPILNEMFWAVKGEGAYCNGEKLSVSSQEKLQSALIATGFPYAKVNAGVEYLWVVACITNLLPHIQDISRITSYNVCYTKLLRMHLAVAGNNTFVFKFKRITQNV